MRFRDQQRVARVTRTSGEDGQEILGLPDPVRRFHTFDDLTEDASFHEQSTLAYDRILSRRLLLELLREPNENTLGTPDVAEPVNVFVIDDFIDHGRTEFA